MTTHYADHDADTGLTLTVELFALGSDTVVYTASGTTAQTNRIGTYRSTFTDVAAGTYELRSRVSSAIKGTWYVQFAGTDAEVVTGKLDYGVPNIVAGASGGLAIVGSSMNLASTGLDSISTTAPSGVASNFREMLVQLWRRNFKKSTLTSSELKTYADNGSTVLTTQTVSDDGTTQTQGAAT